MSKCFSSFWAALAARASLWYRCNMIRPHEKRRPGNPIAHGAQVTGIATGETEEAYGELAKQAGSKQGDHARTEQAVLAHWIGSQE